MSATEFAELLRELKERSGLSYGTLSKRLHMSTSTLHRYCNGDAVPTDYAPVERLARLCKASPQELVELHRRWVLADAVRRKPGAMGTAVAGAAEATGTAGADAAGAVVDAPGAGAAGISAVEAGARAGAGAGDTAVGAVAGEGLTETITAGADGEGPERRGGDGRRARRSLVLAGVAAAPPSVPSLWRSP